MPNTRTPRRTLLAVGALSLAAGGRTAADSQPATAPQLPFAGPFADVPVHRPAYALVHHLAREYGLFTGYPDGSFSGKRALTRYEFAVATQRLITEFSRAMMQVGWLRGNGLKVGDALPAGKGDPPGVERHFIDPTRSREAVLSLRFLVDEFSPEIVMLGADLGKLRASLEALQAGVEEEVEQFRKRAAGTKS